MIGSKTDDVINELFRSFYEITKKDLNQWMEAALFLKVLTYCIIISIKQAWKKGK